MYGIRHISVFANEMRAVVAECAKAAKSVDARDKYFFSSVGESDMASAKAFQSEVPSLNAAAAALAATISQLVDALPKLGACANVSLARQRFVHSSTQMRKISFKLGGDPIRSVGPGQDDLDALLNEARSAVLSMRGALA